VLVPVTASGGKKKTRTNTDFMSVFNAGFVKSAHGGGRNKRLTLPGFKKVRVLMAKMSARKHHGHSR